MNHLETAGKQVNNDLINLKEDSTTQSWFWNKTWHVKRIRCTAFTICINKSIINF